TSLAPNTRERLGIPLSTEPNASLREGVELGRGVRSLREVTERRRRTPREPERSDGIRLGVESLDRPAYGRRCLQPRVAFGGRSAAPPARGFSQIPSQAKATVTLEPDTAACASGHPTRRCLSR